MIKKGCKFLNILSSLFFKYKISWELDCNVELFNKTMSKNLAALDSKIFSEKPIIGEHIESKKLYVIDDFNSFFNSIHFNSKCTITYRGSIPTYVSLAIINYKYFLIWLGIGFASFFIRNVTIKTVFVGFTIGYVICAGLFLIEVLMKWSIVHDILLKTNSKVKRYGSCKATV